MSERTTGTSKRPKCDHCNKLGHLVEKCFIKHPDLDPVTWSTRNNIRSENRANKAHISNERDAENEEQKIFLVTNLSDPKIQLDKLTWIVESGSTSHMTYNRSAFHTYKSLKSTVNLGTEDKTAVAGIGNVLLKTNLHGPPVYITLMDVLHIPTFRWQLISVAKMTSQGANVLFKGKNCSITIAGKVLEIEELQGLLYQLLSCHHLKHPKIQNEHTLQVLKFGTNDLHTYRLFLSNTW